MVVMSAACGSTNVLFSNATDGEVRVYLGERFLANLQPEQKRGWTMGCRSSLTLTARTHPEDQVIFEETMTCKKALATRP
jgi:hypothetical protein